MTIIGAVWIGLVFWESEKIYQSFDLNPSQTISLDLKLEESGFAYYKIAISDFDKDELFVQILDPNENIISDKRIQTRMSVNYFDLEYTGKYILKATNLSEDSKIVKIEFGNTSSNDMRIPGIVIVTGLLLMIISTFRRLQNYKTAQPEENIS